MKSILTSDQVKVIEKAIANYGTVAQLEQAVEEFGELIVAIQKYKRANRVYGSPPSPEKAIKAESDLKGEMADALIMAWQVSHIEQLTQVEVSSHSDENLDFDRAGRLLGQVSALLICDLIRGGVSRRMEDNLRYLSCLIYSAANLKGWENEVTHIMAYKIERLRCRMEESEPKTNP